MPFKARQFYNRRSKTPKTQPKRDWSDYNKKMKMRGDISIFKMMDLDLRSPSFSTLSKRLKTLGLKQPAYRLAHAKGTDIKMIAIDSSGLKCYGQDEWVREKYGEISEKRNWRKLHVSVDQYNIIQTSKLTVRKTHDASVVDKLIAPIPNRVK